MGATETLLLLVTRPNEFRQLALFWLWHIPNRDITSASELETSGWDRPSMKSCWDFLDKTSRSFSSVIKELDGDLARVICLFYLVLRGLDTVEDDMSILHSVKQPLLRSFHEKILTPGFTFSGCGPRERDRALLVHFDVVVTELLLLPPHYIDVIADICKQMGAGMADYAAKAHESGKLGLETIEDLDLYCHYVAGLVGEGVSRIFSASGKEREFIGEQLVLSNDMGLLLQKTNVLRDFREDVDQGRLFWPREIWGTLPATASDEKKAAVSRTWSAGFSEPTEMYEPKNRQRALWALSAFTLDALRHAVPALDYLSLLRNQTVFNFSSIPQTMAMATLALCFMNPTVFERNVKIRKGEAANLIMRSTNPREVALMFRHYARIIHHKAVPSDPNFLRISIACGKIEQWYEHRYPSFVTLSSGGGGPLYDGNDLRGKVQLREQEQIRAIAFRQRSEDIMKRTLGDGPVPAALGPNEDMSTKEVLMYAGALVLSLIVLGMGIVWALIWYFD